jgi:calcium-dependent protein kinase
VRLKKVCVCPSLSTYYNIGKMLGKGNFAKVHLGEWKANNGTYAIKSIEKAKIQDNPKNLVALQKEIQILRRIDHSNVIKMYEVYESELYVHLILEYLKGGELFQQIQRKGVYSEKDAAIAIKCLLSALAYCHERNIIHRDLKPENLILMYYFMQILFLEMKAENPHLKLLISDLLLLQIQISQKNLDVVLLDMWLLKY